MSRIPRYTKYKRYTTFRPGELEELLKKTALKNGRSPMFPMPGMSGGITRFTFAGTTAASPSPMGRRAPATTPGKGQNGISCAIAMIAVSCRWRTTWIHSVAMQPASRPCARRKLPSRLATRYGRSRKTPSGCNRLGRGTGSARPIPILSNFLQNELSLWQESTRFV